MPSGSVDVTVTATSKLDNSTASDIFVVELNGGGSGGGPVDPVLTPIEAQGDVTLAQDASGNLYANDVAITRNGDAVTYDGVGSGLTPVAVEQNIPKGDSTVNAMLLEADDGSIWRWELTAGWEYVRYFGANDQPGSTGFYTAETQFGVDVNGDSLVGPPTFTPIETSGAITLAQDASGNLYANDVAITRRGKAVTFGGIGAGLTPVAVEQNIPKGDSTVNAMLLEAGDGSIWRWELTAGWEYVRYFGANDQPGSTGFYTAETQFGVDVNNDARVGAPALTPIEAQGAVTLAYDASGNLYANDVAITRNGDAVTYGGIGAGLTPVAAEQNIPRGDSTVNAMLLEASDGSIWRWELTAGWEYVRYFGANDQPGSTGFYTAETQFGVDVNNDARVGAPALTPIEAQGDVTLAQDASGNLYANDVAITRRGKAVTFGGIGAGLTPVAVEQNIPKGDSTINAMLLEAGDGSIWRWELTAGWEYVRYFGANDQPESTGFYNAETQFGVDVNNDARVGAPPLTPIEAQGAVTLAQDASGNLYANDVAITRRGKAVTFGGIGAGLTPVAVEQNIPKGDSTINAMLLEAGDGSIWRWELTAGWEYVRYFGANDQPESTGFYNAETQFGVDVNNDARVGAPPLTPIEAQGAVTLAQDASGNLYANDVAITRRGKAVTFGGIGAGLTPVAVEQNIPKGDSTVNAMLLEAGDGSIWRWELTAGWEYVRYFGANDQLGTAGFNNAELNFESDVDGDGQAGVENLIPIEINGDNLSKDAAGNLYAGFTAISRRGSAVSVNNPTSTFDLIPLAVESNTPKGDSVVNSLLLKADDGSIWRWEMNANWEYVRFFGANDTPGTTGFNNAELHYQIDINQDGKTGVPELTPIEAQGGVTLAQDASGNLYANDVAITRRGKAVTFGGIGAGLTPVAVEQNIPKGNSTVNAMLLEAGDGSIWRWELTTGWEYVRYFGANDQPDTSGFLAAEILFNIDVDGNSSIG